MRPGTHKPITKDAAYTLHLKRRGEFSAPATINIALSGCQLDRASEVDALLRWAAEFLTGQTWEEITVVEPLASPSAESVG